MPGVLKLIPLAAVAAILIYIGWRLCEPALFARMPAIGRDRFVVFVGTVLAILPAGLLLGMLIGVAIELALLLYLLMLSIRFVISGRMDLSTSSQTNMCRVFSVQKIRLCSR